MKSTVRKRSLYKPAVFAKLLNRADVSLFTELQKDVVLQKNSLELSHFFSSHIGFSLDGMNVHLGIPKLLWSAFKRFNWQTYDINYDFGRLILYYDVEVERVKTMHRSYGEVSRSEINADRLKLIIPCHPVYLSKLKKTSILHICCMNDEQERDEAEPPVSITKVHKPTVTQ